MFRSLILTDDAPERSLNRLAAADEALRIAEVTNDVSLRLEAHVWRVMELLVQGRSEELLAAKAAIIEIVERYRLRARVATARSGPPPMRSATVI